MQSTKESKGKRTRLDLTVSDSAGDKGQGRDCLCFLGVQSMLFEDEESSHHKPRLGVMAAGSEGTWLCPPRSPPTPHPACSLG